MFNCPGSGGFCSTCSGGGCTASGTGRISSGCMIRSCSLIICPYNILTFRCPKIVQGSSEAFQRTKLRDLPQLNRPFRQLVHFTGLFKHLRDLRLSYDISEGTAIDDPMPILPLAEDGEFDGDEPLKRHSWPVGGIQLCYTNLLDAGTLVRITSKTSASYTTRPHVG